MSSCSTGWSSRRATLLGVVGVHVEAGAAALRDVVAGSSLLGSLDQSRISPLDRGDVGEQLPGVPALFVDAALERFLRELVNRLLELLAVFLQGGDQVFAAGDRHEAGHSAPVISLERSQSRSAA